MISNTVLTRSEWVAAADQHAAQIDDFTAPYLARAARGQKHPVADFLYNYYQIRPARLRRWHPGAGVLLEIPAPHEHWPGYDVAHGTVSVNTALLVQQRLPLIRFVANLSDAIAARPAQLGCFGMHEWAMVFRADDIRHPLPLRLGRDATDEVVAQHEIRCTHIDAFRFFTPDAQPLNEFQLSRDNQMQFDQPGCLHANMDLFKWCQKLTPLVPSELTWQALELAKDIRDVDMQASPYDVSTLGLAPIPVETPAGKLTYRNHQLEFAQRAQSIRAKLATLCHAWLAAANMAPAAPLPSTTEVS